CGPTGRSRRAVTAFRPAPPARASGPRSCAAACTLRLAEDAAEDRVDVLGVVAEIEDGADLVLGQVLAQFLVGKKRLEEIHALLVEAHGVALHEDVGGLPRDAAAREFEQQA